MRDLIGRTVAHGARARLQGRDPHAGRGDEQFRRQCAAQDARRTAAANTAAAGDEFALAAAADAAQSLLEAAARGAFARRSGADFSKLPAARARGAKRLPPPGQGLSRCWKPIRRRSPNCATRRSTPCATSAAAIFSRPPSRNAGRVVISRRAWPALRAGSQIGSWITAQSATQLSCQGGLRHRRYVASSSSRTPFATCASFLIRRSTRPWPSRPCCGAGHVNEPILP